MDFFERQDQARHNTKLLIIYFVAGVATLILALYLATLLIFNGVSSRHHLYADDQPQLVLWNAPLFVGVALGTLAVVGMGSAFKTLELAQGGKAVATMLGGRLISSNTSEPDERKLLNVVEEMAIAAGLPVPQVFVLPQERAINAFAAGHSTSDAVITVTEGSLKFLTRDELQGVIGHEFSHVLNGDMRLNVRLMGIIFGIVCLAVIGRILLQTRGSRDRNPLPLLGLALLVIGWIGVFFGRLIQAAVSRQREFLADASSVQFTRNPAGLAGALKKIGGLSYGSKLEAAHAEEAGHMFFSNGMGESFFHLLDTHPPLEERIHAIDPAFDGTFPPVATAIDETAPPRVSPRPPGLPAGFPGLARPQAGIAGLAPPLIIARTVMPSLGRPTTAHLRYAEELRNSIPASLQAAAREPLGASALIYALLVSPEAEPREQQLELLRQNTSEGIRQETERLLPDVASAAVHARLPLVDLALPALKNFSPPQYQQFCHAIELLIASDNQLDLLEYVLQKIVLRHLAPHFDGARKPVIQYYALKPLASDCAILLSALAYAGQDAPEKVELAFQQGAQALSYAARVELSLAPAAQCELSSMDAALNRLLQAVPQIKKNVLAACAQVVAADGVIQEREAELLRAIADTLDCPMPPFL